MPHETLTRAGSSDAELITAVRDGDTAAFGDLFERHRIAATRLARQLIAGPDADDLVSDAFTKVLTVLQDGRGPDVAFRAYLLTAIRRLHIDRIRANKRVRVTDDEAELDTPVEFFDAASAGFEQGAAANAFASLPERWQLVLWHLDVEGQKPADVAPLLGMSANSVSALAYRAREGLRQAFLQHHLSDTGEESCRWTTERLGAHIRKGLSNRDSLKVEDHLDGCRRCMGIYLELVEVNSSLGAILAPALLGSAAAGYLAATASSGAAAGAVAGGWGIKSFLLSMTEPAKGAVASAGVQGVAVAAVVTTLAAAGTITVVKNDVFSGVPEQPTSAVAAAPQTDGPGPNATAEPTFPAPTTPAPEPPPTSEPVRVTPFLPPKPLPSPADTVTSPPTPSTEPPSQPSPPPPAPQPAPRPISPTDLSIGSINVSSDSTLLQSRVTVPITAQTAGRAKDFTAVLSVDIRGTVRFRGVVTPGWDCGDLRRNSFVSGFSCSRVISDSRVPPFVFKAQGLLTNGTVRITSPDNDDPNVENNTGGFSVGLWLLGLLS